MRLSFRSVRNVTPSISPQLSPGPTGSRGAQGVAPNPLYDPLDFAITEVHNRGMELHAWFNPYRAYRQDNTYARSPSRVVETHPNWIITCPDGYKLLDPGLQEVRNYVTSIVMDVVRRHSIDAVHFDVTSTHIRGIVSRRRIPRHGPLSRGVSPGPTARVGVATM